jgi:ParB family transcriptional regulator, chromosome partitioning protein
MKKQALGKGIRAFIPEEYGILKGERYADMDIELIKPNALQPRIKFGESGISELAQSIKTTGVLQPIVVVPDGSHYRIIVGERRWRAAQKAGLKRIPAIVRTIPKEQELEVSLIENLQREELNSLEIANAYQRLVQELDLTQQDVADKVGKDRTSVTNYLRLLKLPAEVQEKLANDKISMGHARALISVENAELQVALTRQVVDKQLSVRELERLIQKLKHRRPPRLKRPSDPNLEALEEELLKALGTRVVLAGSKSKGVIKIFYFSMDELNRLYDHIKGARR